LYPYDDAEGGQAQGVCGCRVFGSFGADGLKTGLILRVELSTKVAPSA